jgi:hypothetical protein
MSYMVHGGQIDALPVICNILHELICKWSRGPSGEVINLWSRSPIYVPASHTTDHRCASTGWYAVAGANGDDDHPPNLYGSLRSSHWGKLGFWTTVQTTGHKNAFGT